MIDWLPNYNSSNIVIALRAALAAAAILYVLEIYDIKNGIVGAIEGVCRDMLKSADVVPNLLLLFPPAPARSDYSRREERVRILYREPDLKTH